MPIELSTVPGESFINEHLNILQDSSADLSLVNAFKQYKQGKFILNVDKKVNFGFTNDVIWASILINNSSANKIKKVFYIDSPWMDRADFYFIRDNKVTDKAFLGDTLPFNSRKNKTRMLSKKHVFNTGVTLVLMRFQSKDPLIIPLFILSESKIKKVQIISSYFYGFIYGAFFILLIYNIAISMSLKDKGYVLYFLYLLSFFILNIAYTGHGFMYIWPDNILLQQWLFPFFIYLYIIFGVSFCFKFLKLKVFLSTLYRCKLWIYTGLFILAVYALIQPDQVFAVKSGLFFVSFLSVMYIYLGIFALKKGNKMAKFFIPALLMGTGGASISAATTLGIIPYHLFLFHSVEVGMLIEMSILALALGSNLKEVDKARVIAEVNAQIDHLTELYNRRAFIKAVLPQWHLGIRDRNQFSIILIDIDWFKNVNDDYGHAAGDAVLKDIAYTLKGKLRKSDVLARWGGEEFIIFLPNTQRVAAMKLANVIRKKIEKMTVLHEGLSLSITASCGVADFDDQMNDLDDLIKIADVGLYKAKNSGRNIACTVQKMPEVEPDTEESSKKADSVESNIKLIR